ncbi:MAG: hypothetical protein BZY88_17825 [SAR202 cluster bacterium Io17-Chloro-G9]|nr:MAG: hypothetical protein BZY88_17825 [SAR202 cluster bacterium Io17-Chloro-G9]
MQTKNGMQRLLYVGMHDGVCAVSSADGGQTWRQSKVQPLAHAAARLSASASAPGRAYLAAYESRLYRTDDAGETWTSLDSYPSDYAHSVLVHPEDHQLVYAGTEPAAIYRSRDGGENWEECAEFRAVPESINWNFHAPTRDSHVRDLRMAPGNPSQMFAGIEVGGMVRSDDGGDSWQQLQGTNDDVHCIGMSPNLPRTVYVATARAPYRSDDGGETWKLINQGLERTYALHIAAAPGDARVVLLTVSANSRRGEPQLQRSTDGGETWNLVASLGSGTEPKDMVVAIDWDLADPNRVYAGTDDGRIFSSEDQGVTWKPLPVNLGTIAVGAMVVGAA